METYLAPFHFDHQLLATQEVPKDISGLKATDLKSNYTFYLVHPLPDTSNLPFGKCKASLYYPVVEEGELISADGIDLPKRAAVSDVEIENVWGTWKATGYVYYRDATTDEPIFEYGLPKNSTVFQDMAEYRVHQINPVILEKGLKPYVYTTYCQNGLVPMYFNEPPAKYRDRILPRKLSSIKQELSTSRTMEETFIPVSEGEKGLKSASLVVQEKLDEYDINVKKFREKFAISSDMMLDIPFTVRNLIENHQQGPNQLEPYEHMDLLVAIDRGITWLEKIRTDIDLYFQSERVSRVNSFEDLRSLTLEQKDLIDQREASYKGKKLAANLAYSMGDLIVFKADHDLGAEYNGYSILNADEKSEMVRIISEELKSPHSSKIKWITKDAVDYYVSVIEERKRKAPESEAKFFVQLIKSFRDLFDFHVFPYWEDVDIEFPDR